MSINDELPLEETPKGRKAVQDFKTGEVMTMIETKWADRGEHIVLFDCPNEVGMKQQRRCDAVAIGMWQRSGYLIHGMEIKVSRGDWLRELKQTEKADPFLRHCDRWWLVTGNINIAKPEEIPDYWGWMNATGSGLRIMRPPKVIESTLDRGVIDRKWAYALIQRAAGRGVDEITAKVHARLEVAEAEVRARLEREYAGRNRDYYKTEFEALKKRVDEAEAASGLSLDGWRFGGAASTGHIAKALYELQGRSYDSARTKFTQHINAYTDLIKRTQAVLDSLDLPPSTKDDI